MKLEMTINLGNYQNVKITTNELKDIIECYRELVFLLLGWRGFNDNAENLYQVTDRILGELELKAEL